MAAAKRKKMRNTTEGSALVKTSKPQRRPAAIWREAERAEKRAANEGGADGPEGGGAETHHVHSQTHAALLLLHHLRGKGEGEGHKYNNMAWRDEMRHNRREGGREGIGRGWRRGSVARAPP
jgi:hypothetical protein